MIAIVMTHRLGFARRQRLIFQILRQEAMLAEGSLAFGCPRG